MPSGSATDVTTADAGAGLGRGRPAAPNRSWRAELVTFAIIGAGFGMTFGAVAALADVEFTVAVLASAVVFSGSSQLALLGVVSAGGSAITGLLGSLLLNVRFGVLGLAVANRLRMGLGPRLFAAHLVLDPSVAFALVEPDPARRDRVFVQFGLVVYVFHVAGTAVGFLSASVVPDPTSIGLDAVLPAAFLAVLSPQLRWPGAPVAAGAGALIALALLPFAPAGVPILVGCAGGLIGLVARRGSRRVVARPDKEGSP